MSEDYERFPFVARLAGILGFVSIVFGFFGEVYIPSQIVTNDALTTARNIQAHELLFRIGFATYLIEAICDVTLSLLFYVLLRPIQKDVALLAAFFGLISTALYAVAELFLFASLLIVKGGSYLASLSGAPQPALALLFIRIFANGAAIFMVFYGIAALLRGYLMFASRRYVPAPIGVLLMIAGSGFIAKNFLTVLAPRLASDLLLAPMFVATLALSTWLVIKGVDTKRLS